MNRSNLENRIRDEIKDYPSPESMSDKLDCWGAWGEKAVISRWSWFWKRIQFWRYKVIKLRGKREVLWRFR